MQWIARITTYVFYKNILSLNQCGNALIESGSSLIEIVLSLMLISMSLLGLMRLHILALQVTDNAFLQSIAVVQLQSIIDRLAVNPNHPTDALHHWNKDNKRLLPSGMGFVTGQQPYLIRLTWIDSLTHQSRQLSINK